MNTKIIRSHWSHGVPSLRLTNRIAATFYRHLLVNRAHYNCPTFVQLESSPDEAAADSIHLTIDKLASSTSALNYSHILSASSQMTSTTGAHPSPTASMLASKLLQTREISNSRLETLPVAFIIYRDITSCFACNSPVARRPACNFASVVDKDESKGLKSRKASSVSALLASTRHKESSFSGKGQRPCSLVRPPVDNCMDTLTCERKHTTNICRNPGYHDQDEPLWRHQMPTVHYNARYYQQKAATCGVSAPATPIIRLHRLLFLEHPPHLDRMFRR